MSSLQATVWEVQWQIWQQWTLPALHLGWASVKVYSVRAPRAGNHTYAKMYNKLMPDTWSIINHRVRDAASAAHVAVTYTPHQPMLLLN